MLLQDSQGIFPNLSKNQCRINIPIVAWEYERNIQPISQCYADKYIWNHYSKIFTYLSFSRSNYGY